MVQEAVAHDQVVGRGPWGRQLRQGIGREGKKGLVHAHLGPPFRRLGQALLGQSEHGPGPINTEHGRLGEGLPQKKGDVAGTAAQIQDLFDSRRGLGPTGDQVQDALKEGLIGRLKIRLGVGLRLVGVVHELGLADSFDGFLVPVASIVADQQYTARGGAMPLHAPSVAFMVLHTHWP